MSTMMCVDSGAVGAGVGAVGRVPSGIEGLIRLGLSLGRLVLVVIDELLATLTLGLVLILTRTTARHRRRPCGTTRQIAEARHRDDALDLHRRRVRLERLARLSIALKERQRADR